MVVAFAAEEANEPVTDIRDDELVKIAAFKLVDTARCLRKLAKEAETPRLQQWLTASSLALSEQAQELRVAAENLERKPLTLPGRGRSARRKR